ncbi:MAG: hypothetical protein ND895_23030 [Pyrinomonadaceae bacterium]|nr:hypothetical protein [Pyrinomonadaceae bacterium]
MTNRFNPALLTLILCLLSIVSNAQTTEIQNIQALIDETESNAKEFAVRLRGYKHTLRRIEQELNDKGEVKSEKVTVHEVFPGPDGAPIAMLVSKNGKDLSPEQLMKEKRRVKKLWEKAEAEVAKTKEKQTPKWPSSIFLTSDFSMLRMDRIADREMVVLRLSPKPVNDSKDFMSQLEGEVWIDVQDKSLARLDAKLPERYKVGGGFLFSAYLQPGTSIVIESARLSEGIWALRLMEFIPVPRSSLGVKLQRLKQREERSDYRLFDQRVDKWFAEP